MTNPDDDFDAWYYDECSIDAAELVGPNSCEYEDVHTSCYEDDARRAAALLRYQSKTGGTPCR